MKKRQSIKRVGLETDPYNHKENAGGQLPSRVILLRLCIF